MRVLPPHSQRIRLGWLRPLARLVNEGITGRSALAEALFRRVGQDAPGWTAPYSHFQMALTKPGAPHIAQMAQLYPADPQPAQLIKQLGLQ